MKKKIVLNAILVCGLSFQPHVHTGIIDWLKDSLGMSEEVYPQMKELDSVSVNNVIDNLNDAPTANITSTIDIPKNNERTKIINYQSRVGFNGQYPRGEGLSVYQVDGWNTSFRDATREEGQDFDKKKYLIADKVIANAGDYINIAKQYYKKGYEDRQFQEGGINKQKYRQEGALNAAYLGSAGIAAIGATGYGVYRLINWYRGELHALKKSIQQAQSAVAKAIAIANKEGFKIPTDVILYNDISQTQVTLKNIYESIIKEEQRRKASKK